MSNLPVNHDGGSAFVLPRTRLSRTEYPNTYAILKELMRLPIGCVTGSKKRSKKSDSNYDEFEEDDKHVDVLKSYIGNYAVRAAEKFMKCVPIK